MSHETNDLHGNLNKDDGNVSKIFKLFLLDTLSGSRIISEIFKFI